MRIVSKPKKESEVLAAARKGADKEKILKEMVAKAECCVDHLCGCR